MSDTRNPMLTTIVTVHVSQDHINRGKTGCLDQCPIALAILGRLGMLPSTSRATSRIGVTPGHVSFYKEEWFTLLPDEIKQFIWYFDSTSPVKPFSFRLEVPYELVPHEFM